MNLGTLYGIGVGPGDPELITVKGAAVLRRCRHVFVPKARIASDSLALAIARPFLPAESEIHELVFPMTRDESELTKRWEASADTVAAVLRTGADACFLTLGDPLVYSTYVYLLRAVKARLPEVQTVAVPGITSFCAAAALTDFPLGEGKEPITIIPAADDLSAVRAALQCGGTVVVMKIGERLPDLLRLLEDMALLGQAVFVSHAGQSGQRVETDLGKLKREDARAGYLSIILVKGRKSDEGRGKKGEG